MLIVCEITGLTWLDLMLCSLSWTLFRGILHSLYPLFWILVDLLKSVSRSTLCHGTKLTQLARYARFSQHLSQPSSLMLLGCTMEVQVQTWSSLQLAFRIFPYERENWPWGINLSCQHCHSFLLMSVTLFLDKHSMPTQCMLYSQQV